ncbi:hypothetical protein BDQ17DRAFT_1429713 [Cyathus striatus]|nr:hypothetical protein BDQ17DRAFT_1429713 [Cyathus striatus]
MPSIDSNDYEYRPYPIDSDEAKVYRWRKNAINYAVDPTTIPGYRSDYWHQGLPTQVMGLSPGGLATIHFRDTHRSTMRVKGIALSEAEKNSEFVENRWVSLEDVLPYELTGVETMELVIKWRGYPEMVEELIMFDCNLNRHRTLGEVAQQIAMAWRKFYNKRKMHRAEAVTYHNGDFPLRLGSDGITFDHIRLEQMYTMDGNRWYLTTNFVLPAIPGSEEYELDPGVLHHIDDVLSDHHPWMNYN